MPHLLRCFLHPVDAVTAESAVVTATIKDRIRATAHRDFHHLLKARENLRDLLK